MFFDDVEYHPDLPVYFRFRLPLTLDQSRLHTNDAAELIDILNSYDKYIEFERYYTDTYKGNPLHHAVICNNINVATALILKGADVNKVDQGPAICYAIRENNEKMVSLFLNNKVSARHGTYTNGKTKKYLFEHVCQYSNLEIVKLFMSKGCTANDYFTNNRTCRPLHAAIMGQKLKTTKYLINHGADVNQKNALGETPLYLACKLGRIDLAEILLKSNALVNVVKIKNKKTAFYHVIKSCNSQFVKLLLDNGALVDNEDPNIVRNICNPLNQVIRNNGVTILRDILEAGLSPDFISSSDNNNVQYYEMRWTCNGPCRSSSDNDPESDKIKNIQGSTLLHTAVLCNNIEIVRLLLEYKADVYIRNSVGHTPLHTAAQVGNEETMELLLEADPRIEDQDSTINMQDSSGNTPLHLACVSHSTPCILLLIDWGANIAAENYKGNSILHLAVTNRCEDIVELIAPKVPINALNNHLNSPLHLAAWKRSPRMVKALLRYGANTVIENMDRFIPLEIVLKHLHTANTLSISHLLRYTKNINDPYHRRAFRIVLYEMVDKQIATTIFELFFKFGYILHEVGEDIHALLYVAARNGHTIIVKMLLQWGADPNTVVNMKTVLHVATKGKHADIIAELLKGGADPCVTNVEGKLDLYITIENNDPASFELLLHSVDDNCFPELLQFVVDKSPYHCDAFIKIMVERGADVNAYHNGQNILHYILSTLQFKCPGSTAKAAAIVYVLEKGIHVDARTSTGLTALHLTAGTQTALYVKTLLNYGAYVDAKTNDGSTPLLLHCYGRYKEALCVIELLNYNADIHARNSSGTMAIDMLLDWVKGNLFLIKYHEQPLESAAEACVMHLTKLRLAGLYIHPDVSERVRLAPFLPNFEQWCQDELEALKKIKLNTYVSGYDFLVRNLTDVDRFIRDDDVRAYIESEINSDKYPLYGSFIESKLVHVKNRSPYLARAETILSGIHERGLPDICTGKIASYLDLEDLINLANCTEDLVNLANCAEDLVNLANCAEDLVNLTNCAEDLINLENCDKPIPVVIDDQSFRSTVVSMFYKVISTITFGLFQRKN